MSKVGNLIKDNINEYFEITKNNFNAYNEVLLVTASFIDFLQPEYQNRFIAKYFEHIITNLSVTSLISNSLIDNCEYESAINIIGAALKTPQDQTLSVDLGSCQYNIAIALLNLGIFEEALPYIQQDYENLPGDYETLRSYAYIAIKLNKVDLVNQLIENSSSEPIKKLINRMANRGAVSTDEIIKISENEIQKIQPMQEFLAFQGKQAELTSLVFYAVLEDNSAWVF